MKNSKQKWHPSQKELDDLAKHAEKSYQKRNMFTELLEGLNSLKKNREDNVFNSLEIPDTDELKAKTKLIVPVEKPRYDDVYFEGVKWLESLSSDD